jgi:hypothetical protein
LIVCLKVRVGVYVGYIQLRVPSMISDINRTD